MAPRSDDYDRPPWLILMISVTAGAVAVLATLLAFDLLVSDAATHAAELERVRSYMYWSQPFVFVMAGLLAAAGDTRHGPARAPVVGLLLGSICGLALRKQNLLPPEPDVIVWLMTAGALFALGGAMLATLIRDRIGSAVGGIVLIGVIAFTWTFLNLGSVSGTAQREVITRVGGQARSMQTVAVPEADVALLAPEGSVNLYVTRTNAGGRYRISRLPVGDYQLRVWDPATAAVVTQPVTVERSITGGTRWQTISLPTLTEETGPLFE